MSNIYLNRIPNHYVCSVCGAKNVKLWRMYMSTTITLLCCNCAAEEQDISSIDNNGMYKDKKYGLTYEISGNVPAIPTLNDTKSYWGYCTVPQDDIDWWRTLPTGYNNEN